LPILEDNKWWQVLVSECQRVSLRTLRCQNGH
jgi:hypothetical protein